MQFAKWIIEQINTYANGLQLVFFMIAAIATFLKFFYEEGKKRKERKRVSAIENLVNSGFLIVASELEKLGQSAIMVWETYWFQRKNISTEESIIKFQDHLKETEVFAQVISGGNQNFSNGISRVSVV
jgi:hypothetical protein